MPTDSHSGPSLPRQGAAFPRSPDEAHLDPLEWFEARVAEGLADLAAGRVFSHEEVKERVRALGYHVD